MHIKDSKAILSSGDNFLRCPQRIVSQVASLGMPSLSMCSAVFGRISRAFHKF